MVVALRDAGNASRYGGKAAGLARLVAAGLPVPEGFCVPASAGEREIREALDALPAGPVAVRSSATSEDSGAASFAGQHLTVLGVEGSSAVAEAVARCRASVAGSASYRETRGAAGGEMAVVVQRMVDARAAGVAFTADPLSGERDVVVVDAVAGLGEKLVSGEVQPEHHVVDRAALEEAASPAAVEDPAEAASHHAGSPRATVRETRRAGEEVLSEAEVADVARLALAAEEDGAAVDVEWAIDRDGTLWLLQARPVTAAGAAPDLEPLLRPHERPLPTQRWTRAIGDEFWADATSPFYFSAMGRSIDERVAKDLDRIRGLSSFDYALPTLRLHGGRAYWSEDAAFEMVRLAPRSLRVDRVLGWLSPETRERARTAPFPLWQRIKADVNQWRRVPEGRLTVNVTLLDDFLARVRAWSDAFDAAPKENVADLKARWDEIEEAGTWAFDFIRWGMSVHGVALLLMLQQWCEQWLGDPSLAGTLLSGLPTRTLDVNRDLWLLGREPDGPAFDAALERFVERHGHRGATREPAAPRWREQPHVVAALARQTRGARDPEDLLRAAGERRSQAERDALARLNRVQRPLFARVLGLARDYTRYREDQRYDSDRLFTAMRTFALAVGRRAVDDGRLGAVDDAFMLTPEEMFALLDGRDREHAGGWPALVAARRTIFERARHVLPPLFLRGDEPVSESEDEVEGDALRGMAVSAGVVEAVARIVPSLEEAERLGAGEVLVTSNTDPGWTGLFLRASGLVLETGGLLAHGAIVAREYGLPAVTAVPEATARIPDGARVRVDGRAGVVTLLG